MTQKRLFTLSEIAELTGFAVPTVSNWIRRFDDFPQGEITEGSKRPRYDIKEVSEWLERRQLVRDAREKRSALLSIAREQRRDLLGTLFMVLQSIRGRRNVSTKEVMEKYEELANSKRDDILNYDLSKEIDVLSELVPQYAGLSDSELADSLLEVDDGLQSRFDVEYTTPQLLVDFLGALAPPTKGAVLDLASGQGRLLEHLAVNGIGGTHLGQDINGNAVVRAQQSARLRGLEIKYMVASGIAPIEPASCALVVVDPPLALKMQREEIDDASWPFSRPSTQDITTAFIQRAVEALEPGGIAFVLSTAALLHRGGDVSELRRQLLNAGVIQGIVALPPGLRTNTGIPLALWILGPPNPSAEDVVMVDASLSAPEDLAANGPVVEAVLAELNRDSLKRNDDYATTVPIRELLTRDVVLRPNAWVAKKRDLIEPQEQLAVARSALDSIGKIIGFSSVSSTDLLVGHLEPSLISLDQLQSRGALKIFRSTGVRAAVDAEGAPVLDARVLNDRGLESVRRLAEETSRGFNIEPGDVVVAAGARSVIARVWSEKGWVAGPAIQVIRPNSSEIDPYFLTAAIEHPRNYAHVDPGALKVQLNIRGFEVPDLSIDEQRGLARIISALDDGEAELHARLHRLSSAKMSVLQAVGSGTLMIRQSDKSEGTKT